MCPVLAPHTVRSVNLKAQDASSAPGMEMLFAILSFRKFIDVYPVYRKSRR